MVAVAAVANHPAAVRQQLAQRHLRQGRGLEVRHPGHGGVVKTQCPALGQLHQRYRRERLGVRGDAEEVVAGERRAGLNVRQAVRTFEDHLVAEQGCGLDAGHPQVALPELQPGAEVGHGLAGGGAVDVGHEPIVPPAGRSKGRGVCEPYDANQHTPVTMA